MTTEERVARAIHAAELTPDKAYHWWHTDPDKCGLSKILAKAAIKEHLAALADAGMVIVPREPTNAMLDAGWNASCVVDSDGPLSDGLRGPWQAMINAMETDHD